jgi:hypothetical protein
VLVVTEVALALILLVGSALLIRTAVALGGVDPGFDARNVLTMRMSLTGPRFQKSESVEQVVRDGVERLRNVPGVVAASATCCVPLEGGYGLPFTIVGRPAPAQGPYHGGGQWMTASPGYFDVFKIPVRRGRVFNDRDNSVAPHVVVINEAMAKRFWPDTDPVGERLVIGRGVMKEFAGETDVFLTHFDLTKPLSEQITYGTYLGAGNTDLAYDLALMPNSRVALTGYTLSTDFPFLDSSQTGTGQAVNAFVTVIDTTRAENAALVLSRPVGGSSIDVGTSIAIAPDGGIYIGGLSSSPDLPVTNGSSKVSARGSEQSFLFKVLPPAAATN